ncbi:MAG: ion transporter [Lutibacter sp.]|nr:ion transporter [Lutibacter sp.]
MKLTQHITNWKTFLYKIIYESGNPAKKWFDFVLITLILLSVVIVSIESVENINSKYHNFLNISEWIITVLFTLEYFSRILVAKKPTNYIFSFYGIIDLFSIFPKYVSMIFVGSQALVVLRTLRFLRAFKILKLTRYIVDYGDLLAAIKASKIKILTFLFSVFIVTVILGTIMFLVEGSDNGFSNIPLSMLWAIVTLTTAGNADLIPHTPYGQFIASLVMILGYVTIAVPIGIFTAEIIKQELKTRADSKTCPHCSANNHAENAKFCHQCGRKLNDV